MSLRMWYTSLSAPFGTLYIIGNEQVIRYVGLNEPPSIVSYCDNVTLLKQTADDVKAYIEGSTRQVTLPCSPALSSFQQSVYDIVNRIPYGQNMTYEEIAFIVNKPFAVRAIKHICLANPFWPIYPTHRAVDTIGTAPRNDRYWSAAEILRCMERRYLGKS